MGEIKAIPRSFRDEYRRLGVGEEVGDFFGGGFRGVGGVDEVFGIAVGEVAANRPEFGDRRVGRADESSDEPHRVGTGPRVT